MLKTVLRWSGLSLMLYRTFDRLYVDKFEAFKVTSVTSKKVQEHWTIKILTNVLKQFNLTKKLRC